MIAIVTLRPVGKLDRMVSFYHRCWGITLVELLVTVAIMTVLASLIFPLLNWIKQSTMQNNCQNNLRQLGVAVRTYADINGGRIPGSRNWGSLKSSRSIAWYHVLPPLMNGRTVAQSGGSYFQCPLFTGQGSGVFSNEIPKSYKMNARIDELRRHYVPFSLDRISDADNVVLFMDAKTSGGMGQWGHAPLSAVDDSRHYGWISVLFADGRSTAIRTRSHAGWEERLQLESADWE